MSFAKNQETQSTLKKVGTIELQKGLKLVSPFPAAYLDEQKALVISDTHLGIESKLALRGIHIPKSVFRDTLDSGPDSGKGAWLQESVHLGRSEA